MPENRMGTPIFDLVLSTIAPETFSDMKKRESQENKVKRQRDIGSVPWHRKNVGYIRDSLLVPILKKYNFIKDLEKKEIRVAEKRNG